MAREVLSDKNRRVLKKFDLKQRADIVFAYYTRDITQKDLAEEMGTNATYVNTLLRYYNICGRSNRGSRPSMQYETAWRLVTSFQGDEFCLEDGEALRFIDDLEDEWEDDDDYGNDYSVNTPVTPVQEPQKVVQSASQPKSQTKPKSQPHTAGHGGGGYHSGGSGYHGGGGGGSPLLMIGAIVACAMIGSFLFRGGLPTGSPFGGNFFNGGMVVNYLSGAYEPEIFEYEGEQYCGNRRFNKPAGVCFKIHNGDGFTIGNYDGGELKDYALIVQSDSIPAVDMGEIKDGVLHGLGMRQYADSCIIGTFKDGAPSGCAYRMEDGVETLIKYNRKGEATLVATKEGDLWRKPNGKELKLKDGVWKGMNFPNEGVVGFDDALYCHVSDSSISFDCNAITMFYNDTACSFDTIDYNPEGYTGTELFYRRDEGVIEGDHYENGSRQTFSASVN